MSDVIKDVVIRVALESVTKGFNAPSGPGGGSGGSRGPSGKTAEQQMDAEAKAIERQLAAFNKLQDRKDAALVKQRQKDDAALVKNDDRQWATMEAGLRGIQAQEERLANVRASAQQQLASLKAQSLSYYASGLEGAFRLAKGIAFVVAADEAQAESFVRLIAKAQGYFDLAGGGIHVIQALDQMHRVSALTKALEATATTGLTAANSRLAASNLAVAGSNAAASGSASLVTKSLMTLNPYIVVGAVAATAAVYAFRQYADSLDKAETAARTFRQEQLKIRQEMATTNIDLAANTGISLAGLRGQKAGIGAGDNPSVTDNDRRRAEIEKAATSLNRLTTGQDQASRAVGQSDEQHQKILETQVAAQEMQNSLLQDSQGLIRSNIQLLQTEYDTAKGMLETAKRQVEIEKGAVQGQQEKFGRLGQGDQARVKEIAKKIRGGESLSETDARFSEQAGFFEKESKATFAAKGKEFQTEAAGTSELEKLKYAERELASAVTSVGLALPEIADEMKKNIELRNKGDEQLKKFLEQLTKQQIALTAFVAELAQKAKQAELDKARSAGQKYAPPPT